MEFKKFKEQFDKMLSGLSVEELQNDLVGFGCEFESNKKSIDYSRYYVNNVSNISYTPKRNFKRDKFTGVSNSIEVDEIHDNCHNLAA